MGPIKDHNVPAQVHMSPTLNQFIGLSLHQGQCVLGKKRVGDLVSGFTMVRFNLASPSSQCQASQEVPPC